MYETDLEILKDLIALSLLAFHTPAVSLLIGAGPRQHSPSWLRTRDCMYVYMNMLMEEWAQCSSLAPGRCSEFHSYSVFKNSSSVGRCLVNVTDQIPKVGGL
jgi:hypothetical protein